MSVIAIVGYAELEFYCRADLDCGERLFYRATICLSVDKDFLDRLISIVYYQLFFN